MTRLVHGRDSHDESVDFDVLGRGARVIRKVDGHVAQILSSFSESDVYDFAVGFAHEEATCVHIFEHFGTDQGFRAVLHRVLEIEIQVLQIASQDPISYGFRKATWHANTQREAKCASTLKPFYSLCWCGEFRGIFLPWRGVSVASVGGTGRKFVGCGSSSHEDLIGELRIVRWRAAPRRLSLEHILRILQGLSARFGILPGAYRCCHGSSHSVPRAM